MAIERVLKVKNPVLLDKVVVGVQDSLAAELPWLDHVFGQAERLVKDVEGIRKYTPNIYLGNNEYLQVLPDESLGSHCFFIHDDPVEVDWARGERSRFTGTLNLIVWVDMRGFDDDDRNREKVKGQVLKVLNGGLRLRHGHLICTSVYDRAENVYQGFTLDEVDNQFLMAPFCGFRFECSVMFEEDCV